MPTPNWEGNKEALNKLLEDVAPSTPDDLHVGEPHTHGREALFTNGDLLDFLADRAQSSDMGFFVGDLRGAYLNGEILNQDEALEIIQQLQDWHILKDNNKLDAHTINEIIRLNPNMLDRAYDIPEHPTSTVSVPEPWETNTQPIDRPEEADFDSHADVEPNLEEYQEAEPYTPEQLTRARSMAKSLARERTARIVGCLAAVAVLATTLTFTYGAIQNMEQITRGGSPKQKIQVEPKKAQKEAGKGVEKSPQTTQQALLNAAPWYQLLTPDVQVLVRDIITTPPDDFALSFLKEGKTDAGVPYTLAPSDQREFYKQLQNAGSPYDIQKSLRQGPSAQRYGSVVMGEGVARLVNAITKIQLMTELSEVEGTTIATQLASIKKQLTDRLPKQST